MESPECTMERAANSRFTLTGKAMRRVLIIIAAAALLSGFFIMSAPTTHAVSENLNCRDVTGPDTDIPQDEWQRYIKVSVPIPTEINGEKVTSELVCYSTSGSNEGQEVDRYYYTKDIFIYIAGLYQFFVGVVGILAAVMILYGGIQWIVAAGNSSRIQSAKNVIFSAIIGLVIAFTSYLLLYLLNPNLVNYDNLLGELTDVSGVQQNESLLCSTLADEPVIPNQDTIPCVLFPALCQAYGFYGINPDYAEFLTGDEPVTITPAQKVACGDMAKTARDGSVCLGNFCGEEGGLCIPSDYKCLQGYLAGTIEFVSNAYVDKIMIEGVCKNGDRIWWNVSDNKISQAIGVNNKFYSFHQDDNFTQFRLNSFISECEDNGTEFAGYYLNVEINDDHGSLLNILPTIDDNFAVDRDCVVIFEYKDPKDLTQAQWTQAIAEGRLFQLPDFYSKYNKDDLDEQILRKNPYECNFKIDRINFPAR